MDNTFPKLLRRLCKEGHLSKQQSKTLRGQFFSGEVEAAEKGLLKILKRSGASLPSHYK